MATKLVFIGIVAGLFVLGLLFFIMLQMLLFRIEYKKRMKQWEERTKK